MRNNIILCGYLLLCLASMNLIGNFFVITFIEFAIIYVCYYVHKANLIKIFFFGCLLDICHLNLLTMRFSIVLCAILFIEKYCQPILVRNLWLKILLFEFITCGTLIIINLY